jgi:hypothetical protein
MWNSAGGATVSGLGIDEVSDNEPFGTATSYATAMARAQALSAYVYAPLTYDKVILDLFDAHVDLLAGRKSERIVCFCPPVPDRDQPTVVGSGTASQTNTTTIEFDAGTLNVVAAMADIGVTESNQSQDNFATLGVYLDIASDAKNYMVLSFTGQSITVQTDDTYWDTHEGNEDLFYAVTPLPTMEVDGETCSIMQRGAVISTTEEIATSMGDFATGYNSIRVRLVGPDSIELPINGLATRVDGFYLTALAAAQIANTVASTPLTFQTIPFVTNVYGLEGMSDYEMGIAANGGYCIAILDNGVVKWRDFVTTKNTPIEDFEHSMVTPDDVAAILFRQELSPYVGPWAIKKEYLTRISMICEIVCKKLVANSIYRVCSLSSVTQDPSDPRQLNISIYRGEFYPARQILVILV